MRDDQIKNNTDSSKDPYSGYIPPQMQSFRPDTQHYSINRQQPLIFPVSLLDHSHIKSYNSYLLIHIYHTITAINH